MEQSRQAQMNNYRAFGRRPGNRNMTVEKPQNGKKTLKRLMGYFVSEKKMLYRQLSRQNFFINARLDIMPATEKMWLAPRLFTFCQENYAVDAAVEACVA